MLKYRNSLRGYGLLLILVVGVVFPALGFCAKFATLETWTDPAQRLSAEQVFHFPHGSNPGMPGVKSESSSDLGYTRSTVWVRFELRDQTGATPAEKKWTLFFNPSVIDELEFSQFDLTGKLIDHGTSLAGKAGQEGSLWVRRPAFHVALGDQPSVFVVRAKSLHSMSIHPDLMMNEEFERQTRMEFYLLGGYFGVLFALFLYNLIVYLATQDRTYLYYVLWVGAMGALMHTLNGYSNLFWSGSVAPSRYMGVMTSLAIVFAHLFALDFLKIPEFSKPLTRAHHALIGAAIATAILSLLPFFPRISPWVGFLIDFCVVASVLLIMASGVYRALQRSVPAMHFLLAWGGFLLLVVVYFGREAGLLPTNGFTLFSVQIGSALEMILLSLALSYRILQLRSEKQRADQKALESEKLRKLVHIICHDMGNPLSVILAVSHMKKESGEREWVAVSRAADHQKAILEYVRTNEAVETGKKILRIVPVSVAGIVENVRFFFGKSLEKKRLQLEFQGDGANGRDCWVYADSTVLNHTIINNVVSNAIKFSEPGGRILVKAVEREGRIEISVADEGVGMPAAVLKEVFSPREATSRSGTQGEVGTGFGMPLVKTMVEAFDGTIDILSATREDGAARSGTRVTIRLPAAPPPVV